MSRLKLKVVSVIEILECHFSHQGSFEIFGKIVSVIEILECHFSPEEEKRRGEGVRGGGGDVKASLIRNTAC